MASTAAHPGDLSTAAGGARRRPSRSRTRPRLQASVFVALAATSVLALAACGRSADQKESTGVEGHSAAVTNGGPAASGDFGTEKGVCGSDGAKGTSNQRGVTDSSITIGTVGDPGSTIVPGLGQEFFDTGEAFAAWCNKAGGINGRTIKLVKHDAKMTDAAARMLDACQTDFMVVGGATIGDAAAVKPRVACKLGQIPAYSVSPTAVHAALQVRVTPDNTATYPIGSFRAMTKVFPEAAQHLAIAGSTFADIRAQGLRIRAALSGTSGFKVVDYQEWPPLVSNHRPFMEDLKNKGALGFQPIGVQDITAPLTAMRNVGWNPRFVIIANQLYDPSTLNAVKASGANNVWLTLDHLPFELADQSPVVKQASDMIHAVRPKAKLNDFTALSLQAWVLWAKSARACGADLSTQCVLAKAGTQTGYTVGGLYPPRDVKNGAGTLSDCFLMMKVSATGFSYDRNATKPNNGFFNCDPANTARLTTTYN